MGIDMDLPVPILKVRLLQDKKFLKVAMFLSRCMTGTKEILCLSLRN